MNTIRWTLGFIVALSSVVPDAVGAASWKDSILLYSPMEGTPDAARAAGDPKAKLAGPATFAPGRRGQGLALPKEAGCSYAVEGNFRKEGGTLCAWVSLNRDTPEWDLQKGSWYRWLFGVRNWTQDPKNRSDLRVFVDRGLTLQYVTPNPKFIEGGIYVPDLRWPAKSWHHVGITFKSREIKVYVDGEQREKALTTCETLAAVSGRFVLGCSDETGHGSLDGVVDEFYILSRPLSAEEMKMVYLATGAAAEDVGGLVLPRPVLSAPLEGTTAARLADGATVEAKGMGLEYANWQRGRALVVRRRSYDLKGSCFYPNLPAPIPQKATLMSWIRPAGAKPWEGTERGVRHPLLALHSASLWLELTRSPEQQIVLAIKRPTEAQVAFDVARWSSEDPHHLAATWDLAARTLALWVDGRQVATGAIPEGGAAGAGPYELWIGADDNNQYKGDTAEAAFRDLRLFDEVLSSEQIGAVAAGREGVRLRALGLKAMPPSSAAPQWRPGFAGLKLSEALDQYVNTAEATGGGPTLAATNGDQPLHFRSLSDTNRGRTYSFWFRLPPRRSTTSITRVLSVQFQEPAGSLVNYEDNALSQRMIVAATDGERLFGGNPSTYRLGEDSWHHLALVMEPDGDTASYIDGVLQEESKAGVMVKGIEEIRLADEPAALAEAICWGRALSSTEVASLFDYGAQGLSEEMPVKENEKPYWDTSTAYRDRTGGVDRICLNALWRFLPARGIEAAPPARPWGYSRVPGSFSAVHHFKVYDENMKQIPGETWSDGKGFTRWGEDRYDAGWYERTCAVPAEWKGRRISVVFDQLIAYVARVCINGHLAAHFEQARPGEALLYPPRRVDVSDYAGQTVRISFELGWDNAGTCDQYNIGDVWLVAEDGWVDIESVLPVTKVRPGKTLSVSVALRNSGRRATDVSAEAAVKDRDREAPAFQPETVHLEPAELKEVMWEQPWPEAHLWSPDDPYLYSLTVRLKTLTGAVLRERQQRLGFREFWIAGRDFMLNGRRIHLRGSNCSLPYNYPYSDPDYLRRTYQARKDLGYNMVQYWSDASVSSMGGMSYTLDSMLSLCDEMGFVAFVGNVSHLLDVRDEASYTEVVKQFTRKYGAHASVCTWYVNPNTCWYNYGMHPGNLDCAYAPKEGEPGFANQAMARMAEEVVKAQDPQGRPVFTYASGNFGPLYSAMQYFALGLPVQEEADWPSLWAEAAPKPLLPVETDLKWSPHWQDFEAAERSWVDRSPVPLYWVEHSARYLGDSPYLRTDHPAPTGFDTKLPEGTLWNNLKREPYVLETRALAARDILRGWRGYGMSGMTFHAEEDDLLEAWSRLNEVFPQRTPAELQTPGPKPELKYQWFPRYYYTDRPNQPYYETFKENFSPLLAFIGGTTLEVERKLGEFTAKDHAYYAGEVIQKEGVVVNDRTHRDLSGRYEWEVKGASGKLLQSGKGPLEVPSGEIAHKPFSFRAPSVTGRQDLTVRLRVLEGTQVVGRDAFTVQVYPRLSPAQLKIPPVALLDTPDGKTGNALKAAGVSFTRITSAAALRALLAPHRSPLTNQQSPCLIVGQGRIGEGGDPVLADLDRSGALEKGLNVLILAQRPCPLLNLIAEPAYERYVWPRVPSHPILQGLSGSDLSNWRGASQMSPPYPKPDPKAMNSPHYPGIKWHWGNRGIVSTYPFRKPAYGNFRVLADDSFDLVLSPLMEWLEGQSRVVLCQMEVVDRCGTDPVATELMRRLCTYLSQAQPPAWDKAAYLGSDAGRAYLSLHHIEFREGLSYHDLSKADVIVSDGVALEAYQPELDGFLTRGGTVVLVNPSPGYLDKVFGLKAEMQKVWHALPPAGDWPLLTGVGPSELYWREERTAPVLTDLPAGSKATTPAVVAEIPRGKGRLVVWTVSASLYDNWLTEYQNTRWNPPRSYYARTSNHDKIHRALSVMLTNLGVRMRHPRLAIFTGDYSQNGRVLSPMFRVELPSWRFRTDPTNSGLKEGWTRPDWDDNRWQTLKAPGYWQDQGITEENPGWLYDDPTMKHPYNGVAWYRVKVRIPEVLRGRDLYFDADNIDDYDEVYLNGQQIGRTGKETPQWWAVPRHYKLPADLIRFEGENVLVVRVTDTAGSGGFGGKQPPRIQAPAPPGAFSPYLESLSEYDINAFHNW